jgi:hypothetical protein
MRAVLFPFLCACFRSGEVAPLEFAFNKAIALMILRPQTNHGASTYRVDSPGNPAQNVDQSAGANMIHNSGLVVQETR